MEGEWANDLDEMDRTKVAMGWMDKWLSNEGRTHVVMGRTTIAMGWMDKLLCHEGRTHAVLGSPALEDRKMGKKE